MPWIDKARPRDAGVTSSSEHWRPPRHINAFIIAFVAYDLLTAFKPRIDQKLNVYPFSAFPMLRRRADGTRCVGLSSAVCTATS